jgi:hypothetical protein
MQRFGFYSPLDRSDLDSVRFMHDLDFIGLYERGNGSADGALRHNLVFGGSGTFYRWDNSALWFTVIGNVLATPFNDINFDPYAASWQEEIRYSQKFDFGIIEIGFGHRCRHEIDNYEESNPTSSTKRVTLYAGPLLGYLSPKYSNLANGLEISWGIDAQYIIVGSDYRTPDYINGFNISELQYKFTPHLELGYDINKWINLFSRNIYTAYSDGSSIESLFRTELGAQIRGNAGGIDIYLGYEEMFDDFKNPEPRPNTSTFIGARFRGELFR